MPLNMPAVAVLHGCSFVARGFAGDVDHLMDLLVKAIRHKGFSFIDVIQPCITWGTHSVDWYKDRIFRLDSDYDPADRKSRPGCRYIHRRKNAHRRSLRGAFSNNICPSIQKRSRRGPAGDVGTCVCGAHRIDFVPIQCKK